MNLQELRDKATQAEAALHKAAKGDSKAAYMRSRRAWTKARLELRKAADWAARIEEARLAAALARQAAAIDTMQAAQRAYSANRDTAIDDSLRDKFMDSSKALGREEAAVAAAKRALCDIEAALQ